MTTDFVDTNAQTNNDNIHRENKDLVEALAHSTIYQDYERAFGETTGLPVSMRPVESWQLPHRGKRQENPFCAMMAGKSRSCAACLRLQQQLSDTAQNEPQTLTCELGLSDTAVPIRFGERLVGFLQTGQVFRKKPTEKQFNRAAVQVAQWGLEIENDQLREAYFSTKVRSSQQHDRSGEVTRDFRATYFHCEQPDFGAACECRTAVNCACQAIHSGKPSRGSFPWDGRQSRQHEHLLFLKNVQESDRLEFYGLRLSCSGGKGAQPLAKPKSADQRNCVRDRISIVDPLQPRLQENHRPVSHGIPWAIGFCVSSPAALHCRFFSGA